MSALKWFESDALTRHSSGPYLLGEAFSVLDIMTISSMERLAAGAGSCLMLELGCACAHLLNRPVGYIFQWCLFGGEHT